MLNKLKELREDHEDGFTLIELLVVILIIGILASIAIPVFLNQRKTANDGAVESDMKNAATQVESWIVGQKGTAAVIKDGVPLGGTNFTDIKKEIKTSSGVHIAIAGNANNYCIKGVHENGKNYVGADGAAVVAATTKIATYDNALGGLGKGSAAAGGGSCAAAAAEWQVIS